MWWRRHNARILRAPEGGGAGGGDGGDGGGDGGAGGGAGGDGAPPDWTSTLDEAGRSLVQTKGWKSPNDAIASYLNLEPKIAEKGVIPPKPDAPDEDWTPVYDALGRPESADKYELPDPPEGITRDEELEKWFRETAHKRGLSTRQAKGFFEDWHELQGQRQGAVDKAFNDASAELKRELGPQYEKKMAGANRAAKLLFGENFETARHLKLSNGTYLLDNPFVGRAFIAAYDKLGDDPDLGPGAGGDGGMTPDRAKAELARLEKDKDFAAALTDPGHAEHDDAVDRRKRLYAIAYPSS